MSSIRRAVLGTSIVVGLAVALALFGGAIPNAGTEKPTTATPTPDESDGHEPASWAQIDVNPYAENGTVNGSMTVEVTMHVYGYDDLEYDGVRLCLYDDNGSVLHGESLGSVSSPETGEFYRTETVDVLVDVPPQYVLVDHPELRNDSRVDSEVRVWRPDKEAYGLAVENGRDELREQFGYPRTNEVGKCG